MCVAVTASCYTAVKHLVHTGSAWCILTIRQRSAQWHLMASENTGKMNWNDTTQTHTCMQCTHAYTHILTSHSGEMCTHHAGYHFLFAFNSFHITMSVWVTGGRTFQGLSPRLHVRLSEFDWDPLSLQEERLLPGGFTAVCLSWKCCASAGQEKGVGGWGRVLMDLSQPSV